MNREEKLMEMTEIAGHIESAIKSAAFVPISYIRRYNQLVKEVFRDEDPEIKEVGTV